MSDLSVLQKLIEDQGTAWEEFKKANDARLAAVEKKEFAPADLTEKVGTINADLSRLSKEIGEIIKKMQRPGANPGAVLTPEQAEHKAALLKYLRKGRDEGLSDLERKAMQIGSDPDGGYLVGTEMDAAIDRVAATVTGFSGVARSINIGRASYKKMVKTRGVSGGWLGETEDSSESTEPQYAEIEIFPHRVYAEPWITNDMLEDAEYDLEMDLQDEAGITFGESEGEAFITGDGIKKPRGITTHTTVANASYAWGKVGYVASGGSGAFAASNPGDKFIALQHALRQQYRAGASWLMADATLATVRQFKDGSGAFYLWNPDPSAGFGGRLLGSPVVVDDYMPAVTTNSLSVAYGNWARAYTIVRRRGIAVIRDAVTKKGYTKFHFSRRTGGGVTNFEAFKLMKMASS